MKPVELFPKNVEEVKEIVDSEKFTEIFYYDPTHKEWENLFPNTLRLYLNRPEYIKYVIDWCKNRHIKFISYE